jgi:hypothetical protein
MSPIIIAKPTLTLATIISAALLAAAAACLSARH